MGYEVVECSCSVATGTLCEGHRAMRDGEYADYAETQWDGSATAVVESESDPWVKDPTGIAVSFPTPAPGERGACGELGHFIPGVIAPMNTAEGIERCDACGTFEGDLEAARAVAESLGPGYTVWFHGTN